MNNQQTTTTAAINRELESSKNKRAFLNKFLTKTYHMIDQCTDASVVSWSNGGDSFTVRDVQTLEKEILPKYFNHSKFSSFIRQLNFYGFQKLRSDPDLQTHTQAVRFTHAFFRKGQPEILYKIQRTTAPKPATMPADQIESMQQQIADLHHQLSTVETQMDHKIEEATRTLETNYNARVKNLEASYESLLSTLIRQYKHDLSSTATASRTWVSSPQQPQSWPQAASLSDLADYIRSSNTVPMHRRSDS